MNTPKITPIKVPAMAKPASIPKVPASSDINRAPEFSGEQRPRSIFRPVRLESQPHWSGK